MVRYAVANTPYYSLALGLLTHLICIFNREGCHWSFVISHLYFKGQMTNDKGRSKCKNVQSRRASAYHHWQMRSHFPNIYLREFSIYSRLQLGEVQIIVGAHSCAPLPVYFIYLKNAVISRLSE